jgi:hypothetical protein
MPNPIRWTVDLSCVVERVMAKNERRGARKPATKYPNLQKKMQKGKVRVKPAKGK